MMTDAEKKAIKDIFDYHKKQVLSQLSPDVPDANVGDTISRQAAIDAVDIKNLHRGIVDALQNILSELPSAQRTGRWIVVDEQEPRRYGCSECRRLVWHIENYCPNCGSYNGGQDAE